MVQKSRIRRWFVLALLLITTLAAFAVVRFADRSRQIPTTTNLPANDEVEQMQGDAGRPLPKPTDAAKAIIGHVVRPNGEPAVGVTIIVQAPGNDDPWETTTDVGGAFRVDDLPLELYAIEASQEGYGPAFIIGVVPGGAPLRLVLQTGKEVSGQLLRRGEVVAGGTVHLGGPGLFPQRAQNADGTGRFRVAGLRAGSYEAIAVAPGYSSGFIENLNLDTDDRSNLQLEMLIAPTVELRVHDRRGSAPVEAGVVTISSRPFHVLALHSLLIDGRATIDFLPPGEYWIRVRAPGYMPHEGRFWVTSQGGHVDIALSQGATVQGVVVDEAGNPIGGASLRAVVETPSGGRFDLSSAAFEVFHRLARPHGTPFWWPTSDYVTDSKGRFSISGIPAGNAVIVARREKFSTGMSPPLRVQHDQSYENIRIELERGRRLRGRVENDAGGPIAGAAVSAVPAALPAWIGGKSIVTDRSGAFIFQELPRRVRLSVRHPDYGISTTEVELGEGGLDDYIVRLSAPNRREYSGRVLQTQRGAAKGARVWIMNGASEIPVCTAVTNSDGQFRATHCTALPERIIIAAAGYAPLLADITDTAAAQDWVLRAGGELDIVTQRHNVTATVLPEFHLPLEAWKRPIVAMDRWSRENLKLLAPGAYKVVCETDGFAPVAVPVTISENQRAEAVCPHPHRVSTHEVVVVDSQGAPVPNAEVWVEGLGAPLRATTNAQGRIRLEGDPGKWVRIDAFHESWGQGSGGVQLPRDPTEATRIDLNQPIGGKEQGAFITMLADWGLQTATDQRSLLVNTTKPNSPAASVGFQRGDKVLWARPRSDSRLSVGVRRRNEVVVLELVRGDL